MTILDSVKARRRLLVRLQKVSDELHLLRQLLLDAERHAATMRIASVVTAAGTAIDLAIRDVSAAANYIQSLGDRAL